jgi:tetratricopeptide (TPR) repeat protein
MRYLKRNEEFGKAFRKFRLRSGIKSLIDFSELLAEERYVYDVSLFAKWQSGDRVPRDRSLLLAIITVFLKESGITTLEEVDYFLESAGASGLSIAESEILAMYLKSPSNKTLPPMPQVFVRNQNLLKTKTWEVMNKKHLLFYGMPGIGKTYLALRIANSLKKYFYDGIFWFHSDKIEIDYILNTILEGLSIKHFLYRTKNEKFEKLYDKIIGRNILIIFDNVSEQNLHVLSYFAKFPVAIIATGTRNFQTEGYTGFEVQRFSDEEFENLCTSVLGEAFFKMHKKQLIDLGNDLEFLPITSNIFLTHIHKQPISVLDYKLLYEEHKKDLKMLAYDNKNLYIAIHLLYKTLPLELQELLVMASLFRERDFNISNLARLLSQRPQNVKKKIKKLLLFSILEKINKNNFHLHSIVKEYLSSYQSVDKLIHLSEFYLKNIYKIKRRSNKQLNKYLENNKQTIIWVVINLSKFGAHEKSIELYENIREYLVEKRNFLEVFETAEKIASSFYKASLTVDRLQIFIKDILQKKLLVDDRDGALRQLKEIKKFHRLSLDKDIQSLLSFTAGQIYFEKGRYFAAKTYFTSFVKQGNLAAQAYEGLIYLKQNMSRLSKNYVDKVLKTNPYVSKNQEEIFFLLGCIEVELGMLASSMSYFEQSLKLAKKNGSFLYIYKSLEKLCHISCISKRSKREKDWCLEFQEFKDDFL